MTATKELARIDRLDLREVWPNEAANFTPWLAENISSLGEALGMDLELDEREARVGSYALDVLARDVGSKRSVIIENQLEVTDHTHLGQLLTYMAGFDANVIVWIAKEFRDEHREALDLLNHRTGEDTQFFGVEVELWKIDESRPAVNFKLIAMPNEWRKQTVGSVRGAGSSSPREELYRGFFQELIDTLREDHRFTNARKGQPQSWYYFSAGHAQRVMYGANFAAGGRARVDVYIDNGDTEWNKRLFDRLYELKDAIEADLGESLEWERLDERRASRIAIVRQGAIDDNEEALKDIREWMVGRLLKFKQVFGPRLDVLAV